VAARAVSAGEVLAAARQRIEALNPSLNAFLSLSESADADAAAADRAAARGTGGPLLGVPVAIKDLITSRDAPTTAGSRIYGAGLVANRDAAVVQRLRRAGAVIVGRTNLHEIALGVTNENEHFGPARNPWDRTRVPGGSSGGSAAAVAAGLVPLAVGTDTRGSIRIPAAACGVTGFKATFGLVPTEGVIPLAWSLDHAGPMTRSVEDAALGLHVLAARGWPRYQRALGAGVEGLRIGICDFLMRDLAPDIAQAINAAVDVFRDLGATVSEVDVPGLEGSPESSGKITLAEAAAHYEPLLKTNPDGLGHAVRQRLEAAFQLPAVELARAYRHGVVLRQEIGRVFRRMDLLLGATIPAFPCAIGEGIVVTGAGETPVLSAFPRLTSGMNLAGIPALSIPCGFGANGMPVGLQLVAAAGAEEVLVRAGAAYQGETDWLTRRPGGLNR
jgi:aspartyl-tRNA(Asn)/glutamyl-tRNA(Gln) amidotransferase subunit A